MAEPPELRLVLLGTIGCGKTASGDTILGQLSPVSPSGSSRSCQVRQNISEGRRLTLVEAPRWYWSGGHMEANVRKETERALTLAAPGPHAFLLLVPVGQFTEVEGRVPAELEKVFGKGVLAHTLVLLTCGDYLMGQTEQAYLQREDPGLRELIERCGGRYHIINNRRRHNRKQVQALLEKVESIVQTNGGCYMKTAPERETEEQVKEREQELGERYRVKVEERREPVKSRHIPDTQRSRGGEEYGNTTAMERREERVTVSPVANGVQSAAPEPPSHPEPRSDVTLQTKRISGFSPNADGAMVSQLPEVKPTTQTITTFQHRDNNFGERSSPEASPSSSAQSPISSATTSSSSSSPELRVVLLGRSGSGKSAAGNSILGREEFESRPDSLTSITRRCEKKRALVAGRRVSVVDTPDWFQSESSPDEVRAQISSCVALSSPGPHTFLLCVPVDQPARTELQALKALEAVFGPEAVGTHTLVLFTYADRLRQSEKVGGNGVEAYISGQRGDLLKLVEKCGDRFHVLERAGSEGEKRRNVAELMEKVEQTVREGGGQCYSCPAFQEAENRVRQRQVEIARGRREEQERLREVKRWVHHTSMQPLTETEEVREDEIEEMRDEAERSVSTMNLETLPPISLSDLSPSLFHSMWEKVGSGAKMFSTLLADGSVWVGEGAKRMTTSPVWGTVGSGAKNVHKAVIDSSVWEKIGAKNVPKLTVDSSTVGSGAKRLTGSPMWEKVGSGAKSGARLVADSSMWVGSGAKSLAQSPVWGKVGSGAKSGAKMMANNSMRVGAGIGAGAKKVAQSPVWGKMGSGAKAGAKMVTESSAWEKVRTGATKKPVAALCGALLGLVLGVFLGGVIGGALGATIGSLLTEVGRRKFSKENTLEGRGVGKSMDEGMESLAKSREKRLKTE